MEYKLKLLDNIYHIYFNYKGKLKLVDLGTKNYNLAIERAERYIKEYFDK